MLRRGPGRRRAPLPQRGGGPRVHPVPDRSGQVLGEAIRKRADDAAARVNADSPEQLIGAVVSAGSGTEPSDDTSNARNCRFVICNKRSGKQKAFRGPVPEKGATFMLDPWIARATPQPQSQPVPAARFSASLERSGLLAICSGEGSRCRAPTSWAAGLSGLGCARNLPIARSGQQFGRWLVREQGWLHRVIEDGPSPDSRGRYG